jgi:transposase
MPLGVVVTGVNANDGVQTQKVLESLVIRPAMPEQAVTRLDERGLPGAIGDGGYGNKPSRERARTAGFRLRAPSRGQKQSGVGKIRNAVERCHNFFAQFGRIARRLDRSAKRPHQALGYRTPAEVHAGGGGEVAKE